ncbi:MAG: PEGA domain-containing protein [Bacteroidales bacterium]
MKYLVTRLSAFFLAALMLSASLLSCTSTTMIHTVPEGAKVYLNDEFKESHSYKHSDSAISGTSTEMTFKMDGYQDFYTLLSKNEQVDVGAIVGGVFFLFPFIWTMGYNPSHSYELSPLMP